MRFGIVTLWNTNDNYGGILQTFALQKYLRNNGHDAFIIRFLVDGSLYWQIRHALKFFLIKIHLLKMTDKYASVLVLRKNDKKRKFTIFRKKYIASSFIEYNRLQSLRFFYPRADCYITGSDQVWAGSLSDKNEAFHYLDFGPSKTKRISYAASFGHDFFPEKDKKQFIDFLKRFNKISVREESGVKICEDLGFLAKRCVDSTLLLNSLDYKSIMSKRKFSYNYVYIYSVNMTSSSEIYWDEIRKILQMKNLQPIVTTASGYIKAKELFNDVTYDYSTPTEWISNVYYSTIVLTSSFHGIVFSLIFKKQFIYFPLLSKHKSGNDRIIDLLKLVNLQSRIATSDTVAKKLFEETIPYETVDFSKLNQMIEYSKDFLNFAN